jgi:hypothetical protein
VVEVEIGAESEGEVTSVKMDGGIDRGESRDLGIIVGGSEIFPAQGYYYELSFKFCSISVVKCQGFKVAHMREVWLSGRSSIPLKLQCRQGWVSLHKTGASLSCTAWVLVVQNTSSPKIHTFKI